MTRQEWPDGVLVVVRGNVPVDHTITVLERVGIRVDHSLSGTDLMGGPPRIQLRVHSRVDWPVVIPLFDHNLQFPILHARRDNVSMSIRLSVWQQVPGSATAELLQSFVFKDATLVENLPYPFLLIPEAVKGGRGQRWQWTEGHCEWILEHVDDPGGAGVREPRRPHAPVLDDGAEAMPPPDWWWGDR